MATGFKINSDDLDTLFEPAATGVSSTALTNFTPSMKFTTYYNGADLNNGCYKYNGTAFALQDYWDLNGLIEREVKVKDLANVTSIGQYAFAGCTNLKNVYSPSVTSIGQYAFASCHALEYVSFPACTTINAYAFYYCNAIESISFPAVTNISDGTFNTCTMLNSTSFPNVASIGGGAFRYCTSLSTISFPKCTFIDYYAFFGCTSLKSLYIGTSNCVLYGYPEGVFYGTPILEGTGYIYVPNAYVNTYKTAPSWSQISDAIQGY